MSTTRKIVSAVVALALVAGVIAPSTAAAQTAAELQAQINALMAQIAAMSGTTTSAPAYVFTRDLSVGSTGTDVWNLQKVLNMSADTQVSVVGAGAPGFETSTFGPATKAAVIRFQNKYASQILTPAGLTMGTGYVGPSTRAKLNSMSAPVVTTTTTTTTTTGTTNTTTLNGGAGTIDLTTTSVDTEDTIKEGTTEKVVGFEVEADGSDIALTNVKVSLANIMGEGSSERLDRYVDEVSIWMGDKKVGSEDAADFTRDSGSPDIYSKTIALSNAVVADGKKVKFYVGLTAISNIDAEDIADANLLVNLETIRYTDATGAILSESSLGGDQDEDDSSYDEVVGFEDSSADDDISVKSSSADPDSTTLKIEEDSTSDEYMVFAFKLDVDEDSSDIMINELPITIEINDSDNTEGSTADSIIDEVTIEVGGDTFTSDSQDEDMENGDGIVTYFFTFDDGDFTIDAGDDAEVKVFVKFNDQDGNYGAGTTIQASVNDEVAIDAEGTDDEVEVSSSQTGEVHTLALNAPILDLVSKSFVSYTAIDGVGSGEEDVYVAKFVFDVTAGDEDVFLPLDVATSGASGVEFSTTGITTVSSAVLDASDSNIEQDNSFEVSAGDTERFTFSVYVKGNNQTARVTLGSVWYELDDATPNGDPEVTSGLSDFKSDSTFLSK